MPTPQQLRKAKAKKDKKKNKRDSLEHFLKFAEKELTPITNEQLEAEEKDIQRLQKVYQTKLKTQPKNRQECWMSGYIKKVYSHAENQQIKWRQDEIKKIFEGWDLKSQIKKDPVMKEMMKTLWCDDCKCKTNHYPCDIHDAGAKKVED